MGWCRSQQVAHSEESRGPLGGFSSAGVSRTSLNNCRGDRNVWRVWELEETGTLVS